MADTSIADLLRASVENATDPDPLEIQLPTFDPPLFMSLVKIKDARAREAAMAGLEKIRDESERGLEALARLLVLACQHTTVEIGGKAHELPAVGAELYAYIYPDLPPEQQPPSDVAAVFALYTNGTHECDTVALADAAQEYLGWSRTAAMQAHQVVLGESEPV
jgi:hypothetical protein